MQFLWCELKCYQRLVSHMKEMELKAAPEAVAAAQLQVARQPRAGETLPHPRAIPTLVSCVLETSRQTRQAYEDRGFKVEWHSNHLIGFTLHQGGRGIEAERTRRWSLIATRRRKPRRPRSCVSESSSQPYALGSVPLKSKGQLSLMAREIITFIQSLGHVEVGLCADNEPTMRSLLRIVLNRFLGYLKDAADQSMMLPMPKRGEGMSAHSPYLWILETYTDADWSRNRATRRSTSSAVHAVNGIVVHCSSRGQKVVSLSSAESELHALVSGACDGICLKHSLQFLTGDDVHHVCLVDNSATRQTACKRGAGKLRHVRGKLLWCQDKVASGESEVQQIGTAKNLSDIGTKPLSRSRLKLLLYCTILATSSKC